MTWRYEMALPFLLAVVAVLRYLPRFGATPAFFPRTGFSAAFSFFLVVATVQIIPVATCTVFLLVLLRSGIDRSCI
ncbi:MAG TPA: hypothetical protein VFI86_02185 [Burkholderiales bacterium]|nr:hypothetical protein [Burkholderiales bacterium]